MRTVFLLGIAVYTLCGGPASGQQPCAPHEMLRSALAGEHGESPAGAGIDNRGVVIEVYTARDGSTWTILVVRPDGIACIAGAGTRWTSTLPGEPS